MEQFKQDGQKITERGFKDGEHSLFGYTGFIEAEGRIIGLRAERFAGSKNDLYIDAEVVLEGDSQGYVPGGFKDGERVRIVGFLEPFRDGRSDDIITVAAGDRKGSVKPSNIKQLSNS